MAHRDDFDQAFDAAVARELAASRTEPRAVEAAIRRGALVLRLNNDVVLTLPLKRVAGLPRSADEVDLAVVKVSPSGEGLIWPRLGASVSVPGLVMSVLGGPGVRRAVLSEAGRKAARTVTEKRRVAARLNGARGGRPRKRKQGGRQGA